MHRDEDDVKSPASPSAEEVKASARSAARRKSLEVWNKLRLAYAPGGKANSTEIMLLRERIKAEITIRLPSHIDTTLQVCDSYTCGLAVGEYLR